MHVQMRGPRQTREMLAAHDEAQAEAHDSRLATHDSRLMTHDSRLRDSRLTTRDSRLTTQGLTLVTVGILWRQAHVGRLAHLHRQYSKHQACVVRANTWHHQWPRIAVGQGLMRLAVDKPEGRKCILGAKYAPDVQTAAAAMGCTCGIKLDGAGPPLVTC